MRAPASGVALLAAALCAQHVKRLPLRAARRAYLCRSDARWRIAQSGIRRHRKHLAALHLLFTRHLYNARAQARGAHRGIARIIDARLIFTLLPFIRSDTAGGAALPCRTARIFYACAPHALTPAAARAASFLRAHRCASRAAASLLSHIFCYSAPHRLRGARISTIIARRCARIEGEGKY